MPSVYLSENAFELLKENRDRLEKELKIEVNYSDTVMYLLKRVV